MDLLSIIIEGTSPAVKGLRSEGIKPLHIDIITNCNCLLIYLIRGGSYGQNGLSSNDASTKLYKLVKSAVSLDCEPSKIQ